MASSRRFLWGLLLLALTPTSSIGQNLTHPGITLALPSDSKVKARWVCPPLDEQVVKENHWYDLCFTVDGAGRPLLGHGGNKITSPTRQYTFTVDRYYRDLACLDNGALILATSTHLGFPLTDGKLFNYEELPQARVQPIAEMPVPECRLFEGANGCLYLAGHNPATGKKEVYLLRPRKVSGDEPAGVGEFTRVFVSDERILAVTGDGERTFIAVDHAILKVLDSGAVSRVHVLSSWVHDLAYDPRIGLFYATTDGVGYIGTGGSVELIAAPRPDICVRNGSLFVFIRKTFAVLALDNIQDLKRANLAIKDVPATQSAEVRVTNIRFFEGGAEAPEDAARKYAARFKRSDTRFIYCRIDLQNLLVGKREHTQQVTMEIFPPFSEYSWEPSVMNIHFSSDMTSGWGWTRFGSESPGGLYPGEYRLAVYLNGTKVDERRCIVEGDATLPEAAAYGDMAGLTALLKQGANPNEVGDDGRTALIMAAGSLPPEALKLLLEHGAKPNAQDSSGDTALTVVAYATDSLPAVRLLLSAGANPNLANNEGYTPLHIAAFMGNTPLMRTLLEHGADPNRRNEAGNTPLNQCGLGLYTSEYSASPEAVDFLLEHGADPNAVNAYGDIPLFECARSGNLDVARVLLKHGANVNAIKKGDEDISDINLLTHAIYQYRWETDPGQRDRMRELIRVLSRAGAQLPENNSYLAFENGVDSLLDRNVIAGLLDKYPDRLYKYSPEDPGLRALVLDRLLLIALSTLEGAKSREDFSKALNLCMDARARADMWGMLPDCPEISFNCGLLWIQSGSPANARLYLEEYLKFAPNGSAAEKARELLLQTGG